MQIVTECEGWAYGVYEDGVDVTDAEARHGQALGYFRTAAEAERWIAANTPAAVSPNIPALAAALASALTAYPAEHNTILKGFAIALKGDVTLGQDGIHTVMSQSHPGEYYHCNGACTCRAHAKAPEGRCLHRWSVALVKKAQHLAGLNANPSPWYKPLPKTEEEAWKQIRHTGYGPWPSLAAEICDPDRRVARELAGFGGPTARHA